MKIRRTMLELFLSYIILVIPMLAVSYAITNFMISDMREEVDERIKKESFGIVQGLNERLITYQDKAIKISTIDKLSANKMGSQILETSEGITYLNHVKMMDEFWYDIALAYDGKIYTTAGYSRPGTYFGRTLGCLEESAKLGEQILEEEQNVVVYLKADPYDYLLFHYPIQKNKSSTIDSVNYCIRMDEIYELLEPLAGQTAVWMQITLENQWQKENLYLRGSQEEQGYGSGKWIEEIEEDTFLEFMSEKTKVTITEKAELLGMELQVSYNTREIYNQVMDWKLIQDLCMGIFLFLSILISYRISKKQYRKIHFLKESLGKIWPGQETMALDGRSSDFDTMQRMIQGIITETDRMKTEEQQVRERMKEQAAMLLFYGGIREKSSIMGILESCGFELQEPYFTVACIVAEGHGRELPDPILEWTGKYFGCVGSIEGRKAVIVLLELPHEDLLKEQREKLAWMLWKEAGGKDTLKIAFSQTYENMMRVPGAYLEAAGLCQKLLHTEKQNLAFMDTIIDAGKRSIRFEERDMEEFENAIMSADAEGAKRGLDRLIAFMNGNGFLEENREYLRYCIVQSVVLCLKNLEEYRDTELIQEIAACDLTEEEEFEERIRKVLEQVCQREEKEKKVQFSKIVAYINANYHRYDLSLEDVAEYAGLSKSYMSRLFKEKTGSRYIEYLTRCRMEHARKLLEETDLGIKEIAVTVGYSNVPGFRGKFKEYYGMNASEYRRQHSSHFQT